MRQLVREEDGTLPYAVLLAVFAATQYWRLQRPGAGRRRLRPPQHALTGLAATLLAGPHAFVDVAARRRAVVIGVVLVAVNLVVEVLLDVLGLSPAVNRLLGGRFNTDDPVDAVYGGAAVALVAAALPWRRRVTPSTSPGRPGASGAGGP